MKINCYGKIGGLESVTISFIDGTVEISFGGFTVVHACDFITEVEDGRFIAVKFEISDIWCMISSKLFTYVCDGYDYQIFTENGCIVHEENGRVVVETCCN
jgi:hypothetical protein